MKGGSHSNLQRSDGTRRFWRWKTLGRFQGAEEFSGSLGDKTSLRAQPQKPNSFSYRQAVSTPNFVHLCPWSHDLCSRQTNLSNSTGPQSWPHIAHPCCTDWNIQYIWVKWTKNKQPVRKIMFSCSCFISSRTPHRLIHTHTTHMLMFIYW